MLALVLGGTAGQCLLGAHPAKGLRLLSSAWLPEQLSVLFCLAASSSHSRKNWNLTPQCTLCFGISCWNWWFLGPAWDISSCPSGWWGWVTACLPRLHRLARAGVLLAKRFATCVGKDGPGAEMLAMVTRGLGLMQCNAEQLISFGFMQWSHLFLFLLGVFRWQSYFFLFLFFSGRSGFGQSQRSGAWPSAACGQLALTHGHWILLDSLHCVPHCK